MATIRPTGYLAHYGFSEEDVLEHYGVKGMKWGKHKSRLKTFIDQRITGADAKSNLEFERNAASRYADKVYTEAKYAREGSDDKLHGKLPRLSDSTIRDAWNNVREFQNKENRARARARSAQKAYEKSLAFKASAAVEKGKKKISDLLKAADAGWNKSRTRDTAIKAANKASDVVESIRNKDGTISFKKKKKS